LGKQFLVFCLLLLTTLETEGRLLSGYLDSPLSHFLSFPFRKGRRRKGRRNEERQEADKVCILPRDTGTHPAMFLSKDLGDGDV
jgi:hypothetical protein